MERSACTPRFHAPPTIFETRSRSRSTLSGIPAIRIHNSVQKTGEVLPSTRTLSY